MGMEGITRVDWPPGKGGIVWLDVSTLNVEAASLVSELSETCRGVTEEMVSNLITPDEKPAGQIYAEGDIRLASTFAVYPQRDQQEVRRGVPQPAGYLVFQPVELLCGADWLITCWHPTRTYRGTKCESEFGAPRDWSPIGDSVEASWNRWDAETAGDLGTLIMGELALTYAPAHREIFAWLEDWELGFYMDDSKFKSDDLALLWGDRAVLRDWLMPLNRPGISQNPAKHWLPGTNQKIVTEVDDRIDRALVNLGRLGDALRSSFSILHVQQGGESRERNESLQRRIEIAAAVFLVPTLVVGFYGANTWVPGERAHWGFWVMITTLIAFTAIAVFLLTRWHRVQRSAEESEKRERARVMEQLFRAP